MLNFGDRFGGMISGGVVLSGALGVRVGSLLGVVSGLEHLPGLADSHRSDADRSHDLDQVANRTSVVRSAAEKGRW